MKPLSFFLLLSLAVCQLSACKQQQSSTNDPGTVDSTVVQSAPAVPGLLINHFGTDSTGTDSIWLVDGDVIILGLPVNAASRNNKLNEEEVECLKPCKKGDGSYDLACIQQCPVAKRFTFSVPAWKSAQ